MTNSHSDQVRNSLAQLLTENQARMDAENAAAAARVARIGRQIERAAFGGPTTAQEDEAWRRVRAGAVNDDDSMDAAMQMLHRDFGWAGYFALALLGIVVAAVALGGV